MVLDERRVGELLDTYDDLGDDVSSSNHNVFEANLRRWFHFIDGNPPLTEIARRLEAGVDFDEWYKEGKETVRGMVGSGSLDWPPETDRRLALQLSLFRAFAADREGVSDFCTKFMYAGNHYDDMVAEVNDQLFRPMARDLRRLLARELEAAVTGGEEAGVPASDRYVRLDHNSPAYTQTVAALEAVVEAVRRDNEYGSADPDDRDQRIAELEAGKRLLQEVRVRVDAAHALFVGTLGYLAVKFADAAIGNMANEALNWVRVLLGF